MTALLLTGTHILAVLAGAWAYAKWPRPLPRNRVPEPAHIEGRSVEARIRFAEGS